VTAAVQSVAVLRDDERHQTNSHYDQDPELFALFLDPTMKYSAGLFVRDEDSLEQAQLQKMNFVADLLALREGMRVLDVGCGWGALALHLAAARGCEVVGLTPSPKQASFVRQRATRLGVASRVDIRVAHVQENDLESQSFDAITLLGSIVHMKDKAGVLADCYRLCRPRGRIYLSETCFRNSARAKEFADRPGTLFVRDAIFGWGELIPLSDYVRFFEDAGFSLIGLTDLTEHYYQTIERWRSNAEAHRDKLDAIERGVTDKLVRYFDVSNAGWGFTTKHYALVAARSR
jgi:cyclopropane-fatty-acyl-phospholipid synthase